MKSTGEVRMGERTITFVAGAVTMEETRNKSVRHLAVTPQGKAYPRTHTVGVVVAQPAFPHLSHLRNLLAKGVCCASVAWAGQRGIVGTAGEAPLEIGIQVFARAAFNPDAGWFAVMMDEDELLADFVSPDSNDVFHVRVESQVVFEDEVMARDFAKLALEPVYQDLGHRVLVHHGKQQKQTVVAFGDAADKATLGALAEQLQFAKLRHYAREKKIEKMHLGIMVRYGSSPAPITSMFLSLQIHADGVKKLTVAAMRVTGTLDLEGHQNIVNVDARPTVLFSYVGKENQIRKYYGRFYQQVITKVWGEPCFRRKDPKMKFCFTPYHTVFVNDRAAMPPLLGVKGGSAKSRDLWTTTLEEHHAWMMYSDNAGAGFTLERFQERWEAEQASEEDEEYAYFSKPPFLHKGYCARAGIDWDTVKHTWFMPATLHGVVHLCIEIFGLAQDLAPVSSPARRQLLRMLASSSQWISLSWIFTAGQQLANAIIW